MKEWMPWILPNYPAMVSGSSGTGAETNSLQNIPLLSPHPLCTHSRHMIIFLIKHSISRFGSRLFVDLDDKVIPNEIKNGLLESAQTQQRSERRHAKIPDQPST